MKVLVISLLRLGDVLLSTPVLRGLRNKYPQSEIHLMINDEFSSVGPLIPFVDRLWQFDRSTYQEELADANTPFLNAFYRIREFVDEVNKHEFDLVINLTHSKLSGYLASLIHAKDKIGLTLSSGDKVSFGSKWFRYLNDTAGEGQPREAFHYVDVYRFAVGVKLGDSAFELLESEAGEEEALKLVEANPFALVQAYTSDAKKNWPESSWIACLKLVQTIMPHISFGLLGSPAEQERINELNRKLREEGINSFAAVCSLEGAFSLLQRAELLVTGDTSIKHLACASRVPIIELSLGSSDFRRTGVYKAASLIIKPRVPCMPCKHSSSCHRPSHECAEKLSPELVGLMMVHTLKGQKENFALLAREWRDEAEVYLTELPAVGFWHAQALATETLTETIRSWVGLSSLKLFLQEEYKKPVGRYGSEGQRLSWTLDKVFGGLSKHSWMPSVKELEREVYSEDQIISKVLNKLHNTVKKFEDAGSWQDFLTTMDSSLIKSKNFRYEDLEVFKSLLSDLDAVAPSFTKVRQIQERLLDLKRKTEIKLKLMRSLRLELETGGQV